MRRIVDIGATALMMTLPFLNSCYAQQSSLNSPEAIAALRQRAATGDLAAMHELGARLQDDGDTSNDIKGRDLLIQAGRLGYSNSASYLAHADLYGWYEWSRVNGEADFHEGLRWLRAAGDSAPADTLAQDDYRMLGHIYSGFPIRDIEQNVIPVDRGEAIKWYRLCAVEFERFCEGRLGELLIETPESAVEGFKWIEAAAAAGNVWSMYKMADLYAAGDIVQKDLVRALIWYERSRQWNPRVGGNATALYDSTETRIEEVSKLLIPQEIARALEMATKFRPSDRN
jgi:TPR repeat protein